jgi:hypothetical protein
VPPHGEWPAAALDRGLLFREARGYRLWDPATERTVRRVPYKRIGDLGPTDGDLVASAGTDYRRVVLTDFGDGSRSVIPGLPNRRLVTAEAQFSPDGTKLAVPVLRGTHGWRSYSQRGRHLAIVDVATGDIHVIRHSAVPPGYLYTAWSSDGRQVFLTGGATSDHRGAIVSYALGDSTARRLHLKLDTFYGLVAS